MTKMDSSEWTPRTPSSGSHAAKVWGVAAGAVGLAALLGSLVIRSPRGETTTGGAGADNTHGGSKPSPDLVANPSTDRIVSLRREVGDFALALRKEHDRSFSRKELKELREYALQLGNEMHAAAKTDLTAKYERKPGQTRLDAALEGTSNPDSKRAYALNKVTAALTAWINGALPVREGEPQTSDQKETEKGVRAGVLNAAQVILSLPEEPLAKK